VTVQSSGSVEQRFWYLETSGESAEQSPDAVAPSLATESEEQPFDSLLSSLLRSECSPLVVASLVSPLSMGEIASRLRQPVCPAVCHVPAPRVWKDNRGPDSLALALVSSDFAR
jgi:hypothetical protein